MQKWLNDLYAIILKQGFNPGSGGGSGGDSGGGSGGDSGVLTGKYLGDNYTTEQKQVIANGTFEGLNIGDYWTINGINWRIADFDYYYNVGSTPFTKHHVIIIPDTILYEARMSDTNNVCYSESRLYQIGMASARVAFDNAFGDSFIPTHKGLYSNTVSDGVPSGWSWKDMRIELMNEVQLYGHGLWTQNAYDVGTQKTQFRLFSLDKTKINIGVAYWLTSVKSSSEFTCINRSGEPSYALNSKSYGVRPFACLCGD